MNFKQQDNLKQFKKIKNKVKAKIISFLKNELSYFDDDVNHDFLTIKITQISENVLTNLQNWMEQKIPEKYKEIILLSIKEEKWFEIIESFKQEIAFGTSGIRGKLVVSLDKENSLRDLKLLNDYGFSSTILRGPNSINEISLLKHISGLLNYMKKMKMSKIVVGYDSRVASKLFSRLVTNIFLTSNFSVILFDENNTLPELSYAVTNYHADMGIEITASHNDKRYNGYKLITKFGSPPSEKIREEIAKEIFNNKQNIHYEFLSYNYQNITFNTKSKKLIIIKKPQLNNSLKCVDFELHEHNVDFDLHEHYVDDIVNLIFDKNTVKKFSSKISIGYCALNGTGYYSASKLFGKIGVNKIKYISKMILPDSLFPLFDSEQILDPSDTYISKIIVNAFTNQYSKQEFDQLDFLCYTDPDADRLGILIKIPDSEKHIYGNWKLLKANDVWSLFLWYILKFISENNKIKFLDLNKLFIVKSFVTSDSLLYISNKYKIKCIDGKVGFTDLTDIVRKEWKKNKINIGMFEESCGFGVAGNPNMPLAKFHILEKDGLLSLAIIIEILSYAKSQNMSLIDLLDKIYFDNEIGYFETYRRELPKKGIFEGFKGEFHLEKIFKNIENFCVIANQKIKSNDPIMICNLPISHIKKYSTGKYDSKFGKNFPDEGIRFFLDSNTNHITIRSSGTEPKIRIFVQYRITNINKNNHLEKKLYVKNLVEKLSDEIEKLIM